MPAAASTPGLFQLPIDGIEYDGRATFDSFGRRVVLSHLLDVCRAAQLRGRWEYLLSEEEKDQNYLEEIPDPNPSEPEGLGVGGAAKLLAQCGAGCTPYLQEGLHAVWLKAWGFPVSEISRRTGLTPSQVNKRMRAAKKMLQSMPEIRQALL